MRSPKRRGKMAARPRGPRGVRVTRRENRGFAVLELTDAERELRTKDAVRDLPTPDRKKITKDDVATLRRLGLDELAEIAERYLETSHK